MKITQTVRIEDVLEVNDLEYNEQGPYAGYITGFTVHRRKYVRQTVFRVQDPRCRENMRLVQTEYSYLHSEVRRYWQKLSGA